MNNTALHVLLPALPALLLMTPSMYARGASPATAVAFAPDGQEVLVGSQAGVEIRSWPGLELKSSLATELQHVHDIAFSPDGRHVLLAGGAPAESGVVEVVRWPEHALESRVTGHRDLVMRVAWSQDGARLVTASADGSCHCIAAQSHDTAVIFRGHSQGVVAACFLPDGRSVASAGLDQTIQLWDCQSAKLLRTLSNHTASVNDVALKPNDLPAGGAADGQSDGQATLPLLASAGDDRTIRLWQPTIGRLVRFVKLGSIPRAILWSPGGKRLFVGSDDGNLRILDGEMLEVLETIPLVDGPVYAMALSPSGDALVVAGAGNRPRRHQLTVP